MSRFFSKQGLKSYTPGEQPKQMDSLSKLNTNESPYPPSPAVQKVLQEFDYEQLRLYSSPTMSTCKEAIAMAYGVKPEQILVAGGSDEALAFIFMAFFDQNESIAFPDITYGFYQVYADLFGIPTNQIPLENDFCINPNDYKTQTGAIIVANPNAPTGIALSTDQIQGMLEENRDRLLVVDEAYIDFSENRTMLPFINQYDNLLIVQTFSKSRALAGSRLGFVVGNEALIQDLETIKFSFNPYNIDRISEQICIASMQDDAYLQETVSAIKNTRVRFVNELQKLRYTVLPSEANFVFAKYPTMDGKMLYNRLKQDGILVRHFDVPRIADFVRITIGTDDQMDQFIQIIQNYR